MNTLLLKVAPWALVFNLVSCQSTRDAISQGNAFAHDGMLREAVQSYQEALKISPSDKVAHRNLGMVLVRSKEYKSALRHLEKAVKEYESDAEVNFFLAEAYRGEQDFSTAIFYYQKALKLNPDDPKVLKSLAWSYFRIRYYAEALNTATRLRKMQPNDSQAAIILARTLLKLNKAQAAAELLAHAKETAKKNELPFFLSIEGDVLFELGKLPQALKVYQQALKLNPMLAGALLGMGKAELKRKNHMGAARYLSRVLRIKPQLSEAHLLLGQAFEHNDRDKAIEHYQAFQKSAAADPEFLTRLSAVDQKIEELKKKE